MADSSNLRVWLKPGCEPSRWCRYESLQRQPCPLPEWQVVCKDAVEMNVRVEVPENDQWMSFRLVEVGVTTAEVLGMLMVEGV